jgi:hypothetical protein
MMKHSFMGASPFSAFFNKLTQLGSPALAMLTIAALVLSFFSVTVLNPFTAHGADYDVTGEYVISFDGVEHDVTLTQDEEGNVTGGGEYTEGTTTYAWEITEGEVHGHSIHITAEYTEGTTGTLEMDGVIDSDGSMSGSWEDTFGGDERSGDWETVSGDAEELPGSLAAEDFGVVDYDTGLGQLSGYSAGFGLTDATFENVQSVVVELFSGTTLLQTNTATAKLGDEVTGNQISSPFDVSGDFDYATDGFWINEREAEYGQSVPATMVVAHVTLENGKELTATNTNLTGDPTTIYPDEEPTATSSVVTITKFVDGAPATASTTLDAVFTMSATWDADNVGAGTGNYTLNAGNDYEAMTVPLSNGGDYTTNEVMDSTVAAACATGTRYALEGYTVGDTYAQAASGTPSLTVPAFTDLQGDKYVIVWNDDCTTDDEDEGELAVNSIETIDGNAIANGDFDDGWKYVFHLTIPTDETNVAMKFSNWLQNGGSGVIPVANNMRISSAQADNGGATITLTAADTYSAPELHMTGDLNPLMDGLQVDVTVEVAIPSGTPNGSYTTNYGVRSNP